MYSGAVRRNLKSDVVIQTFPDGAAITTDFDTLHRLWKLVETYYDKFDLAELRAELDRVIGD